MCLQPLPWLALRRLQLPHNCFCTISANVSTVKKTDHVFVLFCSFDLSEVLRDSQEPLITLWDPHIKMHWAFLPALYFFLPAVNVPVFRGLAVIQSGVCEGDNSVPVPGRSEESPGQAFIQHSCKSSPFLQCAPGAQGMLWHSLPPSLPPLRFVLLTCRHCWNTFPGPLRRTRFPLYFVHSVYYIVGLHPRWLCF